MALSFASSTSIPGSSGEYHSAVHLLLYLQDTQSGTRCQLSRSVMPLNHALLRAAALRGCCLKRLLLRLLKSVNCFFFGPCIVVLSLGACALLWVPPEGLSTPQSCICVMKLSKHTCAKPKLAWYFWAQVMLNSLWRYSICAHVMKQLGRT